MKLGKPTMPVSESTSNEERRSRNARILTLVVMISILPTAALFAYFGYVNNLPQLYISTVLLMLTFLFDFYIYRLVVTGRSDRAMTLLVTGFLLNVMVVPFIVQGLGFVIALSIVVVALSIFGLAMSSRYSVQGLVVAIGFSVLAVTIDNLLLIDRVRVPELERFTPVIVAAITFPLLLVFLREFNRFTLQTKITLGIMLTGGVAIVTLIYFGSNRASIIGTFLGERYENSVRRQTETNVQNAVAANAEKLNDELLHIQDDLTSLATYRAGLESKQTLADGRYWNAAEKLFILPGGQYGNSGADLSSVFLPNKYGLDERMISDINTSILLDLVAPELLDIHSEVAAVYYISREGYTIYYPNIRLAENIPADFDPVREPFFTIAAPENNPERLPRFTPPYQDPAGAGLILTISVPVYTGNTFEGVVGADVQLARITDTVSDIQIRETGFAALVDENGFILAMPEAGYDFFRLEPEVVEVNQTPRQSILNSPLEDVRELSLQAVSSNSGISRLNVNDTETYLSVAVLEATQYKLIFIAPAIDLDREIISSRTEVEDKIAEAVGEIGLILTLLFVGAFIVSLAIGQFITRPLKRLTETVEQIATGNLSSRVSVETGDESGTLARAFNTMADRLSETLQGLEERIADRTSELETVSQVNARRAALFESIARISRIISSTRSLDQLLPQIAETISSQLGYYHVGIFLVDIHKEYAVLAAANSEGGKAMLARNHRLRIGETGIVGNVAKSGSARVALNVGDDAVYFNNPDLPETRSEVALPLRSGVEIIGALDVQSRLANDFSQEDVNVLSALADQVSIAIQNARSFQQSLEALQQAERAAAQLSEQQWSRFVDVQPVSAYQFDGVNTRQIEADGKTQPNQLAIPITLRGIQIGTLKLSTTDPSRKWDPNEVAMVQATAERTALAIETARLLQEAQKRAAKERAIGQISAKIGSLVNIDNIVRTTIQELGTTLPGTDVAIQFTSPSSNQNNRRTGGSDVE